MVKIEKVYDSKVSDYVIFVLAIIGILSLIYIFYFNGAFIFFHLAIFLLILFSSIYVGLALYYSKKGKTCVKKVIMSQNQSISKNHNAIIILNSERNTFTFWGGIDVLIEAFEKRKCPFKLYCCNSAEEIDSVLKNPYATSIWLFGHGWRGGFSLYKKKNIVEYITLKEKVERRSYRDLIKNPENYPKKEFIAQFHCNHIVKKRNNISLPELLLIDSSDYRNSYVSNYKMSSISIVSALKNEVIDRIKCPS